MKRDRRRSRLYAGGGARDRQSDRGLRPMSSCLERGAGAALLGAMILSSTGCSYAFVHGPHGAVETQPAGAGGQPAQVECTSSNAAPIVDTVSGVALVGVGVLAIIAGAEWGSCNNSS